MKELANRYGVPFVLAYLPALAGLLSFAYLQPSILHTAVLGATLAFAVAFLLLADHLAPVAGPFLVLVLTFLIIIRTFDGIEVFYEVYLYFTEPQEESLIAADLLVMLSLMAVCMALIYLVRFFWTRLILAAALGGLWIFAAIAPITVPKAVYALVLPSILFSLVEALHHRKGKQLKGKGAVLLILCLFSSLVWVMPYSAEPYPYTLLHKAWDGIQELWERVDTRLHYRQEGGTEFSMDFNGTGTGRRIGEGTEEEELRQLLVWSDFGDESVIYLPGVSLDYFDGAAWENHIDEEQAGELLNWKLDTAEHVYALFRLQTRLEGALAEENQAQGQDSDQNETQKSALDMNAHIEEKSDTDLVSDYFRQRRLEITYRQTNSRTLFTTPGLLRIKNDEERFPYQAVSGRVRFDYAQEKETAYTLFYLENNTRNLPDLIRKSQDYAYEREKRQSWGQITGAYSAYFVLDLAQTTQMEESLSDRKALIDACYLQLPENLPPEIYQLSREITQGLESDYDKLMAIEDYLQQGFSYTLTPQLPDKGEDFLSHMMDVREGYCTWFATASAILSRAAGIPARYVEGYRTVIPRQTRVILDEDDTHAWCEAYIEGYGWIVVEATPGFESALVTWENEGLGEEGEAVEEIGLEEEKPAEEQDETGSAGGAVTVLIVSLILLTGAGGFALYLMRKRYQALPNSEKIRLDMFRLLKYMKKRGYIRQPYESVRTFFKRIYWQGLAVNPADAMEICGIYEDVFFGEQEADEEAWLKQHAFMKQFRKKRK
ncbi:MAG: hypothetical protein J6P72_01460 [Firmicutes bacterium]|nr:hypothetical protein [Bacillota bacterium]